jgi:hypothetical protein
MPFHSITTTPHIRQLSLKPLKQWPNRIALRVNDLR